MEICNERQYDIQGFTCILSWKKRKIQHSLLAAGSQFLFLSWKFVFITELFTVPWKCVIVASEARLTGKIVKVDCEQSHVQISYAVYVHHCLWLQRFDESLKLNHSYRVLYMQVRRSYPEKLEFDTSITPYRKK